MDSIFITSFTPSLMSPEDLEAVFVQREDLASRLTDLARESALTGSRHHVLLCGPRGIGKTHLLSVLYYRLTKMEDVTERLRIAWLREEEWGVSSFLELLLRILRALDEEYPDLDLRERTQSLYEFTPAEAEVRAGDLLQDVLGDRTLLILAENLDDLFKGLKDQGQKGLRAYIQNNGNVSVIATSPSLFNDVTRKAKPFYGFFRTYHLSCLSADEAVDFLSRIAERSGKTDLLEFLQTPIGRARVKAVHHIAGGNHRVYVIFSQFLSRKSLDDLVEPFMKTLNELTPYYQAKMKEIAPQQRKIVEYLCDRRGAIQVKEIAKSCFITHQTASKQLGELLSKGYVKSHSIGRDSFYELAEPLMRLCLEVKKLRGEPITLFIDFMVLWYTKEELREYLESIGENTIVEREYVLHALKILDGDESISIEESIKNYIELIINDKVVIEVSGSLCTTIFLTTREARWGSEIQSAIDIFEKHNHLDYLGVGLLSCMPTVVSTGETLEKKKAWVEVWRQTCGNRKEFEIPLRFFEMGLRAHEIDDERISLELPIEERGLWTILWESKIDFSLFVRFAEEQRKEKPSTLPVSPTPTKPKKKPPKRGPRHSS